VRVHDFGTVAAESIRRAADYDPISLGNFTVPLVKDTNDDVRRFRN